MTRKHQANFVVLLSVSGYVFAALPAAATAAEQGWIEVSQNRRGFVVTSSQQPFVPWGFNYDHDEQGRLIEDYWHDEWDKVQADFREMKQLGANVVRIHLQFGRFMKSVDEAAETELDRLAELVRLAEEQGLYLDLTGLACYHKQDVPAWYDELEESDRWDVQARFWEAIAQRCATSPAIFCYDLMNEPVVPGGSKKQDNWLGPAFAGKHFVQFITRDNRERPRHAIARAWIGRMVEAIRKHDRRHLITVGMVDWSLDRPGLTSGFVPDKVAEQLDFIAVHLYPEAGKVDEAIATLQGFDIGKPVIIEETFPLKCSPEELDAFLEKSQAIASGWIGFYWGKTPEECRQGKTFADAITLSWLELFERRGPKIRKP